MKASKETVKSIVYALADMRSKSPHRRFWSNRATGAGNLNLCFRFFNAKEANSVAEKLKEQLQARGYTNAVKRSSVCGMFGNLSFAEYIRVTASN